MTWLLSALLVSAIFVAAAILVGRRQKKAERIMREGSQLENTLKRADAQTLIATALYLAAAALYFSPVALPHKIALGLLILTAFSLHGGNPAYIAAAFFFSFLGDLSGSFKAQSASMIPFLGQMGAFAIGHVYFILHFLKMRSARSPRAVAAASAFSLAVLVSAFFIVVPSAGAMYLAVGVGLYAVIISTMMLSAFLTGNRWISLGAVLFVLSDYALAVNMFVTDIPYEKYIIMVTYFLAQLIFFLATRNHNR